MRRPTRILLSAALLSAVLFAAVPALAGSPADVLFLDERGEIQRGVRCATPPVGAEEQAMIRRELDLHLDRLGVSPLAGPIPVAFHVVYSETRRTGIEGYVPLAQIEAQIDVLNAAYAGTGFEFYLASHDYTLRKTWFTGCYGGGERKMKQALAVDPATTLNIYTCKPSGGILGWSYLPWSLPEDSYYHGVVALYSSLPGGTAAPYNEGDTVTHEVGHYLGLYHTFQNGCVAPGDEVDDTPYEASAAFGCPLGRDSCPELPGLDPIENFMDYTDDACMLEFTPDQADRMVLMVDLYKPSL